MRWSCQTLRGEYLSGRKRSVMWVITSCDSSVFGNLEFGIRWVTYKGLHRKNNFHHGKRLGKCSKQGFLVMILLHAGSCSVFPTPKTAFQHTLHAIRAEWTGQLSRGKICVIFLCKYGFSKKKKKYSSSFWNTWQVLLFTLGRIST